MAEAYCLISTVEVVVFREESLINKFFFQHLINCFIFQVSRGVLHCGYIRPCGPNHSTVTCTQRRGSIRPWGLNHDEYPVTVDKGLGAEDIAGYDLIHIRYK